MLRNGVHVVDEVARRQIVVLLVRSLGLKVSLFF